MAEDKQNNQTEDNTNVQRPYKGLVTDMSPADQPKDTYRYALNAVNKTDEGNTNFKSMEKAIQVCTQFPTGTKLIASIYMVDDLSAVFLVGNDYDYIGTVDKFSNFKLYVQTQILGFSEQYPINGTFRIRRNFSKIIYWVDGYHKPRFFNFDRVFDFYSPEYIEWSNTFVGTYTGEMWSDIKFDLIKTYTKIPTFDNVEILNSGNIPSGSYSCAIQLVDENLSSTEWITTCNPVPIYVSSLDTTYKEIRGSRNSTSDLQNYQNASKSIKWTIGNFDPNFSFYRIAVIVGNSNDGNVTKVLVSKLLSTKELSFIYSGNDLDFTLTPLSDIKQTKVDISSAKYIEQLENRVILVGIKGKQIDWCDFQRYASKIKSELVTKSVSTDVINSTGSPKNPVSSFELTGYMWGEVYSFGISYIFNDGYRSPAYHIPGKTLGAVTGMDFYECEQSPYIDIHNCTVNDYWGVNGYDNVNLLGQNIRHHKFPRRDASLYDELTNTVVQSDKKNLTISFNFNYNTTTTTGTPRLGTQYKVSVDIRSTTTGLVIDTAYLDIPFTYINNAQITIGTYPTSDNVVVENIVFDPDWNIPPTYTHTEYFTSLASTINYNDISTLSCGITFTNVERPHPDVIGFEIVRNERTEDDKIIIDNAIIGPLTVDSTDINNPYHTFGLLTPEVAESNVSLSGVYIFSNEHQFGHKKILFDSFDILGTYTRTSKFVPLTVDIGADGNYLGGNGVYVQDVQAGTTFNSAYLVGDDPDGFDLQVLYRSNEFEYAPISVNQINIPDPDNLLYLSAAGNILKNDKIFFNACIDNKIIIAQFDTNTISGLFTVGITPRLLYGSLIKNNTTAYNNFINRTYYKEMNNPVFFETLDTTTSSDIYNGDSYVAPMTICASTYWDMHEGTFKGKKSRVWKIIVGSVLIALAVVVNIIPGVGQVLSAALGTLAAAVLTAVTVLAISYGVSMITSGIEFETMKNMIDQHYVEGLKVTITDADNKQSNYKNNGVVDDDRFQWFTDRLQNIYIESSINTGLRCGITAPVSDFINSPSIQPADAVINTGTATKESFETYLMSKYTIIDREKNDGRLYLGFANSEIYDINLDYTRRNKEKPQFYLPIEYDCCSTNVEQFDNRMHYSEPAFQEEKIDNYRSFLPNNYKDVEGQFGKITNIFRFNNTLYIHTTESLLVMPQNLQERVNQELVTFIGTGEFFALPVRQVKDGENGSFGSSDNRATIITRDGVFFVNTREGVPYLLATRTSSYTSMTLPEEISAGNGIWFRANTRTKLFDYIKELLPDYEIDNNIISDTSVGIHAIYDTVISRIILTKIDYIPTVQLYLNDGTDQTGKLTYKTTNDKFYVNDVEVTFSNTTYFENKSWTMSYSPEDKSWISYHSYLPRIYMATQFSLYSSIGSELFMHHINGKFCEFYGTKYPHIIEYVSLSNPVVTRTWNTVSIICDSMKYNPTYRQLVETNRFFDKVIFSNSKQCSGEMNLIVRDDQNDSQNYLLNTIKNVLATCIVEKNEGVWSINCIRDYVNNYTIPMFVNDWNSIKSSYPIDKIVNPLAINVNKQWFELENLRDKYLVIRLIFSNFEDADIQITTNYSFENEQQSLR